MNKFGVFFKGTFMFSVFESDVLPEITVPALLQWKADGYLLNINEQARTVLVTDGTPNKTRLYFFKPAVLNEISFPEEALRITQHLFSGEMIVRLSDDEKLEIYTGPRDRMLAALQARKLSRADIDSGSDRPK